MARALLIVDVQNDFTEGGALGVSGGDDVARDITTYLADHAEKYDLILASRDWHNADDDNGGHFADGEPNFVDTWPVHCVAGTHGAEYDPLLNTAAVTHHVRKGQGVPAYSLFEGTTDAGERAADVLQRAGVSEIDVVGIATDHCVLASATDALETSARVRIIGELIAGVDPAASADALAKLSAAGAEIVSKTAA